MPQEIQERGHVVCDPGRGEWACRVIRENAVPGGAKTNADAKSGEATAGVAVQNGGGAAKGAEAATKGVEGATKGALGPAATTLEKQRTQQLDPSGVQTHPEIQQGSAAEDIARQKAESKKEPPPDVLKQKADPPQEGGGSDPNKNQPEAKKRWRKAEVDHLDLSTEQLYGGTAGAVTGRVREA
jgi:hypothetical protein